MATKRTVADLKRPNEGQTGNQTKGVLNWQDYFMGVAKLSAMRSKDPITQVGACIVNKEKKIVGIGYNGMPNDCSDDQFPWGTNSFVKSETKHMYVCHAEMNAIFNTNCCQLKECQIYVTHSPCNECAKLIVQSGIKEVFFLSKKKWKKDEGIASRKMFDAANVKYSWCGYQPKTYQIAIDFSQSDQPSPKRSKSCQETARKDQ